MKKRIILVVLLVVIALSVFTACNSQKREHEGVKVVFNLEGGKYANSSNPVVHYYQHPEGVKKLIYAPDTLKESDKLERLGYVQDGWYKVKTVDDNGNVTYSEPWDFATDELPEQGIELYLKWKKPFNHRFNVCYTDADGNKQLLGSYEDVKPTQCFDDVNIKNFTDDIPNSTFLGYYQDQACTIPFDQTKPILGDVEETEEVVVEVFADYIEGYFELVSTARELSGNSTQNIYLLNDIDMQGETLDFGNYRRTLIGNGFTISNFTITFRGNSYTSDFKEPGSIQATLNVSLFGNCNGATVKDVTFENVSVVVQPTISNSKAQKLYVAPLAIVATNSTFENVHITNYFETIVMDNLPNCTLEKADVSAKVYVMKNDNSTFVNCDIQSKTENN